LKKLLNNSYFFPIFLFLALYIWHPFALGIYSDDWGLLLSFFVDKPGDMSPFALDRLQFFVLEFANRPLSGFLYYLVSSICNYDIFLVHLIILFLLILTIFSLNLFYKELYKLINIGHIEAFTTISLTFWIASPWILGFTVWLSSALNLASLIFFLLSSYILLKNWRLGKNKFLLASLLYLLSCLTYESFYFQYLIIIGIGFIFKIQNRLGKKALVLPLSLYSFVLLIAIVWNRYSSTIFGQAIHKETNSYWIQTFIANLFALPYSLFASVLELSYILAPICLIITYLLLKTLILEKKHDNREIKSLIFVVKLIVIGILLAILIYSFAGYTIWGIGSRSRTLIVPSIYFPLLFSIFFYIIAKYSNIKKKYLYILIIITIICLSIMNIIRSIEWHNAWLYQKEIISKLPTEQLQNLDSTTTVIFDGPYRQNWISIIDAAWAIDFQFKYGHIYNKNESDFQPSTNANFEVGRAMMHPILNKPYNLYWDGEYIYTGYDFDSISLNSLKAKYYNKIDTIRAKKLIIWHYDNNTLEYPTAPIKLSFQPFYNYDYWITWIWINWFKKA